MKKETEDKNITHHDQIEFIIKNWVTPNLNTVLDIIGYGFQDGFGEGYFKNISHFGIGLVGKSKRWVCYIFFEDRLPFKEEILSTLAEASESFKNYKRPLFKRNKNNIRRTLIVRRPETFKDVEYTKEEIF